MIQVPGWRNAPLLAYRDNRTGWSSARSPLVTYERAAAIQRKAGERDLQRRIGRQAAGGDYLGASQAAMMGGHLETGINLQKYQQSRQAELMKALYAGAQRAKTPEQWRAYVGTIERAFGPGSAGHYADFENRPAALTTMQELDRRSKEAGIEKTQAEATKLKREAGYGGKPQSALGKLKRDRDRGLISTEDYDRAVRKSTRPALPWKTQQELGAYGEQVQTWDRLSENFKPGYGGDWIKGWGEIKNWLGRTYSQPDSPDFQRAQWWQDYRLMANAIRNKLFGSALTAHEAREFEKAMIQPGMSDAAIKANMRRQSNAARRAAKKLSKSSGRIYGEDVVGDAMGVGPEQLEEEVVVPPAPPPPPASTTQGATDAREKAQARVRALENEQRARDRR